MLYKLKKSSCSMSVPRVLFSIFVLFTLICAALALYYSPGYYGAYIGLTGAAFACILVCPFLGFLSGKLVHLDFVVIGLMGLAAILLTVAADSVSNVHPYLLRTSVWMSIAMIFSVHAILVSIADVFSHRKSQSKK